MQPATEPSPPTRHEHFIIRPATAGITTSLPLTEIFGEGRPVEVDVGCGTGRFLLARCQAHPGTAFLGVDRLKRRLRKIDRRLTTNGVTNTRLLHVEASYAVRYLLPHHAITTYYVFFPDPWPKRRHHRRRLLSPDFLDSVHRTLVPGGALHIATDHQDYFEWIEKLLGADERFGEIPTFQPREEERTGFELLFLEQQASIGRCSYRVR